MKERNIYMDNMSANLVQYDAQLIAMKSRIAEVQSDMRIEYLSHVDHLGEKRDGLMAKYRQLQETRGRRWYDIKIGTEILWDDLDESIAKAAFRFR